MIRTAGDRVREAFAEMVTGAAVCLFSREAGVLFGLDLEKRIPLRLETFADTLDAVSHEITIHGAVGHSRRRDRHAGGKGVHPA